MVRNYDRLLALKNNYDPANLFRMNHNVKSTPAAAKITGWAAPLPR
jgi:hypothetical protein